MKQITAWQAEDGKKFFTEADCQHHEKSADFKAWFIENPIGSPFKVQPDNVHLRHWLQNNAEAIRGFLPPVEVKPELDIKILEAAAFNHGRESDVRIKDVKRWLAGELE